ncbi:alpha/beta-hydrolase [Meredithblackwellia eburnea MCA 4105]
MQVEAFKVEIGQEQLETLKLQVKVAHIPRQTYETGSNHGQDWGVSRDWLVAAKEHWLNNFDWRKQESRINSLQQYTAKVPLPASATKPARFHKIHFIHVPAQTKSSPTQPSPRTILFLHGWPGSILEFIDIIHVLRQMGNFNIVAPSHPGYLYSDPPPLDTNFNDEDDAEIMLGLMKGLGYDEFVIQAGDWGQTVGRIMAVKYAEVLAVHFNFLPFGWAPEGAPDSSTLSLQDRKGLERLQDFMDRGRAYSNAHNTRPSTISLVLSSSPLALLAWIGEKFLSWSDTSPSLDEILTAVTLWFLTDTFPSSIYTYRDSVGESGRPQDWFVNKPTGFSSFAKEIMPVPKAWAETCCDLQFYRYHESGGHFAAMEKPEVLANDLVEFLDLVWKA